MAATGRWTWIKYMKPVTKNLPGKFHLEGRLNRPGQPCHAISSPHPNDRHPAAEPGESGRDSDEPTSPTGNGTETAMVETATGTATTAAVAATMVAATVETMVAANVAGNAETTAAAAQAATVETTAAATNGGGNETTVAATAITTRRYGGNNGGGKYSMRHAKRCGSR